LPSTFRRITGGNGKINTVDVSDPTNPVVIGTAKNEQGQDVITFANEITLSKDAGMAYVTTSGSVQVFDVKDPYNPRLLNTINQLPNEDGSMTPIGYIPAIVEKGGWVYLASQGKGMRALGTNTNDIIVYNENNNQVPEIGYSKGGEDERRYYVEIKFEDPDITCSNDDLEGSMSIKTRKGAVVNPLSGIDHPTKYLLSFRKGTDGSCYADFKKTATSPANKRFIATNFPTADLNLTTPDGTTIAPVFGSIGTKAVFEFSNRSGNL